MSYVVYIIISGSCLAKHNQLVVFDYFDFIQSGIIIYVPIVIIVVKTTFYCMSQLLCHNGTLPSLTSLDFVILQYRFFKRIHPLSFLIYSFALYPYAIYLIHLTYLFSSYDQINICSHSRRIFSSIVLEIYIYGLLYYLFSGLRICPTSISRAAPFLPF